MAKVIGSAASDPDPEGGNMPSSDLSSSHHTSYFERPAEKLVLEGYRNWTRGHVLRSTEPWTKAQLLYRRLLGDEDATRAIVALARFIKTLGQCARCPLRMFRSGSPYICRDETLVMGLIAGIQNCDEAAVQLCLARLCCPSRCDEAAMSAGVFALALKSMDRVMEPIPAHVIVRILMRSRVDGDRGGSGATIH